MQADGTNDPDGGTVDPNYIPPGYKRDPVTGQIVPISGFTPDPGHGAPSTPTTFTPTPGAGDPNTLNPNWQALGGVPAGTPGSHWDATKGYFVLDAAAPTPPGGTPPPATDPNSIFTAPLTKMFDGTFTAPTPTAMPTAPTFNGPAFPTIPTFTAPSAEEAMNDPGYAFRTQQGANQLQNWAAAKGTLNDSGTANALQDYGQNAASQEYQNVWNRDYSAYNTNVQNQYLAPWQASFQNASLANQDAMTGYQTTAAATQHSNDTNYLNSWNEFLNKQNYFTNWQDRTFNKQFSVATA